MTLHQEETVQSRGCLVPGFSLAELVCVTVIIGIVTAIAVPRFSNSIARQRVEAAARRLVVDLTLAQRHAKKTNANQTVQFDPNTGTYTLLAIPDPDHASSQYKVSLTEEPYCVVLVSVDFGGDKEIVFNVYGMPDSGGSVVIHVGSHVRTVTVDADTGKVSLQ